jgi:TolB protein
MRSSVAVSFSVVLASGVVAALVAALVVQQKPAGATFPGKNGRIAFVSNRPGSASYDIYTMSSTVDKIRRLTKDPDEEGSPAWSPDGERIAYEGSGVGDNASNIWMMNADGSNKRKVTVERKLPGDRRLNHDPDFSPGGRRIVFERGFGQRDSAYDLYVIRTDGTGLRRVFDSDTEHPRDPAYSPDGTKIVFEYGDEIATVRPDGTGFDVLRAGSNPDWSPNGERIAFANTSHGGTSEIYTMRADGGGVRRVTDPLDRRIPAYPAFSPGGGRIAFADYKGGDWEIRMIGVDGTGVKGLTRNEANDYDPAWQPVR